MKHHKLNLVEQIVDAVLLNVARILTNPSFNISKKVRSRIVQEAKDTIFK